MLAFEAELAHLPLSLIAAIWTAHDIEELIVSATLQRGSIMIGGTMQERALNQMDLQAQKELDQRFCQAMSEKDLNGVLSCLWNDPNLIVVLFDGTVYHGWENVREAVGHLFSGFSSVRLEIEIWGS
jgi:hypothetical protein